VTPRVTTSRLRDGDCGSSRFRWSLRRVEKDWGGLKAATTLTRCWCDATRDGVTKLWRRDGGTSWRRRTSFGAGHRTKSRLGFVLLWFGRRWQIEPEINKKWSLICLKGHSYIVTYFYHFLFAVSLTILEILYFLAHWSVIETMQLDKICTAKIMIIFLFFNMFLIMLF